MDVKTKNYYVENLNLLSFIFDIAPEMKKNNSKKDFANIKILYFDASRLGGRVIRAVLRLLKINCDRICFRVSQCFNENGELLFTHSVFQVKEFQDMVRNNADFQNFIQPYLTYGSFKEFFVKQSAHDDLITENLFSSTKLFFAFLYIHSQENLTKKESQKAIFFLEKRPWFEEINHIASKWKIKLYPYTSIRFDFKNFLAKQKFFKEIVKKAVYYLKIAKSEIHRNKELAGKGERKRTAGDCLKLLADNTKYYEKNSSFPAKIAVDFYGKLNLDYPQLPSILSFMKASELLPKDILLCTNYCAFPIDHKTWNTLRENNISAVSTSRLAATTPEVPIFTHHHKYGKKVPAIRNRTFKSGLNQKWVEKNIRKYQEEYEYWSDFFERNNVKVYVTWYKFNPSYYCLRDALRDQGGVGAIYQRSYEHFSTYLTSISTDVVFGFSKSQAYLPTDRNANIPYFVITGYLDGDRLKYIKNVAKDIRRKLEAKGVQKVLAFFDENSPDHERWDYGHPQTLSSFEYLLKKVLDNQWLGLVIKPKVAATLRKRLGSVAELLSQTELTGRCLVLNEHDETYLACTPATAALISDIAIHGYYCAATAGIESALTKVPTLYMDIQGSPPSPLDKLGRGKVIFSDWNELWRMCTDHWKTKQGVPGFGDWSHMLDELDPFQDGRASERMGMYLKYLNDGFRDKLPREDVLSNAAEQYMVLWGKDKVLSVNCDKRLMEKVL